MALVGIVLWPIIGLIYIIYKLFQEEPNVAHGFFNMGTAAMFAVLAVLILIGNALFPAISDVLYNVLGSDWEGLIVVIGVILAIAYVIGILLVMACMFDAGVRSAVLRKFDPAWKAMLKLEHPTEDELRKMIDEHNEKLRANTMANGKPVNPRSERDKSEQYTASMRSMMLTKWEIKQYKRICIEMGKTPNRTVVYPYAWMLD